MENPFFAASNYGIATGFILRYFTIRARLFRATILLASYLRPDPYARKQLQGLTPRAEGVKIGH
jgi:hypothetical protein